jgi:hypothetical protein
MILSVSVEGNFHGEPENPLNFEPFGEPPFWFQFVCKRAARPSTQNNKEQTSLEGNN